jgi:hypothetical protein
MSNFEAGARSVLGILLLALSVVFLITMILVGIGNAPPISNHWLLVPYASAIVGYIGYLLVKDLK